MRDAGRGLMDAGRAAFERFKARAVAAADAETARALGELETGVREALDPLQARFARYADVAESLRWSFDSMLGNERLVANPPMSPDARPVALADARVGTLRLEGKVADRADRLLLEVELLEDPPAGGVGGATSKGRITKEFTIERFGWSDDLSPHLAFVKRRGARAAGEPDVNYQPLPIVAWTRHFRPRPAAEPGFWDGLAAATHPGFGLSAAALDFENKGVQLGVGVQLSLFDDFFFVGYGYNVQAGDPYFYFGLGLTRWLGAFGGEP
jgi:hypothetical protein